ncbi:receptor-type tyrosine-protein phosphatase T-like [Haemaphysalis longicornis]
MSLYRAVPVIEAKAELKSVSETAITLQLAALGDQPDDIEAYYVLVQRHDDRKNRTRRSAGDSSEASVGDSALYEWTGGTPDYNESVAMNLSFYMAAKLTPDEVKSQGEFTVGDGRYYGGYYNAPLIPEATYSVGLAAEVNFQGDTRISYQLLTEPITVPGPPSQVYQEGRQETAVVVAWKEPRLSNGVIHGYKVTMVNLNSPAAENVSKVGPEARKVQFDGLEAGTAYVAEVSARTSAGYGKPVNITVYTRPRVPVIETKAELKSVSETAITLQLAALGDQPDDIEAYYVLVQRHDDRKNRTRRSAGDSSEASVGDSALYEWTGGTPDYNESVAMNLSFYMAAKLTPDEVKSQGEFTVGDGRYYGGYYNAPLIPEATYSVGLAAEVNFQGDRRISYQLLTEPITGEGLSGIFF